MNIYARYFNQDTLAHNLEELINFLSGISDIKINNELVDDIKAYAEGDMPYPKRYKIRPRVYFILIKTTAETLEEFRLNKDQDTTSATSEMQIKKNSRINALNEEKAGWYKGAVHFKRVIQNPDTGKFQYQDTTFSALVKAKSGQECYNLIIDHLKNREDVDKRSQFPSAKGNNFEFKYVGTEEIDKTEDFSENQDIQ